MTIVDLFSQSSSVHSHSHEYNLAPTKLSIPVVHACSYSYHGTARTGETDQPERPSKTLCERTGEKEIKTKERIARS